MKIYLAGPLFSSAERAWNDKLANLLESLGNKVFLPQREERRELTARGIFQVDREGIDSSDVVVAVMDGPDPDSGTCWECGYAYGKKPIILIRTDFRNAGRSNLAPYNAMLTESADVHVELPFATAEDASEAIQKALSSIKTVSKY